MGRKSDFSHHFFVSGVFQREPEMDRGEETGIRKLTLKFPGQLLDDFPQPVDLGVGLVHVLQPLLDADVEGQVAAADVDRLR